MTSPAISVPVKLLHEAEGHIVTIQTRTGEMFRGKLVEAEDNMNCRMEGSTVTLTNGREVKMENVYIRGSKIVMLVFPDMLKNAPMFRRLSGKSRGGRGGGGSWGRGRGAMQSGRGGRGSRGGYGSSGRGYGSSGGGYGSSGGGYGSSGGGYGSSRGGYGSYQRSGYQGTRRGGGDGSQTSSYYLGEDQSYYASSAGSSQ